jgi:stage II sporulation protein R
LLEHIAQMEVSLKKLFNYKFVILFLLFFCFFIVSACSYANTVSTSISDSVFRLHVIANSDSEEDQNLKYAVRDALIEYMNSLCAHVSTKDEAMEIANNHIQDFQEIAKNVINSAGFDYDVSVTIGKTSFPTKSYGDVSLPAGFYDALCVNIGSAEGHNWWCVMFPPLCFVDISSGIVPEESKEELSSNLDSEEYDLITTYDNSNDMTFKFKIVELFENLKIKIAQN